MNVSSVLIFFSIYHKFKTSFLFKHSHTCENVLETSEIHKKKLYYDL